MMKFILKLILFFFFMAIQNSYASTVDILQSGDFYFAESDAEKFNSPYFRSSDEDWDWTHNPISEEIHTAELLISSFDVDSKEREVDQIYAYDGNDYILLGSLFGENNSWSYTSFLLDYRFYDQIQEGLSVYINIDEKNNKWSTTLAKSVLNINNGRIPRPNPVPIPNALCLLAPALICFFWRKKC